MIRTVFVLLFIAAAIFLVLPGFILFTLITGNPDPMYEVSMKACRVARAIGGMKVHVEGLENIPSGVCIFVANHVSNADPLALIPSIPRRVSVLIKDDLFRIPILSFGMRLVKFVSIRRGDRESTASSVEACRQVLRQGLPLVIFPEGTRSRDGRLQPFKKGAFTMAIEAGAPIVPVSIIGTRTLLPPGARWLRPGEVTVRIGNPVDASQYTLESRLELTAKVEALVAAGLPASQQPSAQANNMREDPCE
jgi:1-acyl-sn-glycerol-3-phosphate acyltransferase